MSEGADEGNSLSKFAVLNLACNGLDRLKEIFQEQPNIIYMNSCY